MSFKNHSDMVIALCKSGEAIKNEMTNTDAHNIHMSLGIAGEAGEVVDAVKKFVIYNKPVDRSKVIEEMGDLEFYLEGLRQGMNITRDEVINHNIRKLSDRYSDKTYSDKAAIDRADKEPGLTE